MAVGFIVAMIFYWWTRYVFRNLPDIPPVAVHFLLGAFLAVCGAWMCNIFYKMSMHAVAMGGLIVLFLIRSRDAYVSGLISHRRHSDHRHRLYFPADSWRTYRFRNGHRIFCRYAGAVDCVAILVRVKPPRSKCLRHLADSGKKRKAQP